MSTDRRHVASDQMITVTINGEQYPAAPGEAMIEVAERNGIYIPRFCHHKHLDPVGMCRMCLVSMEGPRGPSMQVSCMLGASDNMTIDTQTPEVKKAQEGVLEFLLANHPLDCPVCDKGGECPLQDQAVAFGPGESRFVEEKRHMEKPIPLSDLVLLDRERCILCDRCTRFSRDVAGDPLISFTKRGNATEINTFPDHPFASYFSGNTVQICPVGALTATPYRFAARPWDLNAARSTCTTCAVGCSIAAQTQDNEIARFIGLDVEEVNQGWLCDKGRFGYEALQSPSRLTAPEVRSARGEFESTDWNSAIEQVASSLRMVKPERVGFLGGGRLCLEDQYVWSRLLRAVLGTDFIDAQLSDGIDAIAVAGLPRATIDDACEARTVILVAPDLKEQAPVLYLRLRDAVLRSGVKVVEIAPAPTASSEFAAQTILYRPGELAATIASLIDRGKGVSRDAGGATQSDIRHAREIIAQPGEVVVVCGRANLAESSQGITEALGLLSRYTNATFLPVLRRGNTFGAIDMGLASGLLPGRTTQATATTWFREVWGDLTFHRGGDANALVTEAAKGNIDVLVCVGVDPLVDFPDSDLITAAYDNVPTIIAVDTHRNASVRRAHVALPAQGFGERNGTVSNLEGRVSRVARVVTGPRLARPDWLIAADIAAALGKPFNYECERGIWDEIERVVPLYHGATTAFLDSVSHGVVVPLDAETIARNVTSVPTTATARPLVPTPSRAEHRVESVSRQPEMDGDEIRLVTTHRLYDGGVTVLESPHLAALPDVPRIRVHSGTLATAGFADGDAVKVVSQRSGVVAEVHADDTVARNTVVLPYNLSEPPAAAFIDASNDVTIVRLEKP